jgi:flagellar basal body P-ring formation protein FlgA
MVTLPFARPDRAPAHTRHAATMALLALLVAAAGARAAGDATPWPIDEKLAASLQRLAQERARAAWGTTQPLLRVQVTLGRLDPRLQLAACARVEAFAPAGVPPWGATRIGLRCADAALAWKVTLPATVQMFTHALVVPSGMAAGQTITSSQLALAEVDAAAQPDRVLTDAAQATGRVLARSVAPGEALRRGHLRARQWFAAGDMVRIVASGPGWTVSSEGRAIGHGIEGQPVRARTDGGQTVTGYATGDHRLEVPL